MSDTPKPKKFIEGAEQLSLGVSMIVAVLLGVGIGMLLKRYTGVDWLLWVGVAWGVMAAVLNVYKAFKRQVKSLEEEEAKRRYE